MKLPTLGFNCQDLSRGLGFKLMFFGINFYTGTEDEWASYTHHFSRLYSSTIVSCLGHLRHWEAEQLWRHCWKKQNKEKATKGHFTHEPRAVTMKLWEPKRKCSKAIPTHLQNHVVWSRTLKCSVESYVTGPSTKCYFNVFLFMRVLTHDKIK